ncbi:MAG TPA: hypothetical protein PLJ78_04210 [Anaerolineae bacterium]|nr:hypothetical protein [Anaerolineae bacterium]HQK13135.1 hypothetical protein [Anaerolineae bacterium]
MDMLQESDPLDIVALHASAMHNVDCAVIFLGPSGTGKSTIYRLLSPYMQPLSTDAVYLVPQRSGGWNVVWGDGRIHSEIMVSCEEADALPHAPLRAVVRLYQAVEPRLENIDALLLCRYLTDAFFEVTWQRELPFAVKRRTFANLAKIAHSFPGYVFHFDLSFRTPEMLNEHMRLW